MKAVKDFLNRLAAKGNAQAAELLKEVEAVRLTSESDQVREFQAKFGQLLADQPRHLTFRKLKERVECMREELQEFEDMADVQNLAGMADALIDLVYFAKGTGNMLGLPWAELWADVHRANMAKVRGEKVRQGKLHKVDAIKPPGWVGPNTEAILAGAGYVEERDSQLAVDDPEEAPATDEVAP